MIFKFTLKISMVLSLFLIIISYQNCGKGFQAIDGGAISRSSLSESSQADSVAPPPADLAKETKETSVLPNLLEGCENDPGFNACIFWKNPVAQQNLALPISLNSNTNLSAIQKHAVNITGFDNSGLLKNASFFIKSEDNAGNVQTLSTLGGDFKFAYSNDPQHRVGQVMAFYWLTTQEAYMKKFSGAFYASGKNINVFTHRPNLSNAFWNSAANEIVMGVTPDGNEFALSAEVYAHEMGHANLTYATNGNISNLAGDLGNISCGNNQAVCCANSNGCSWAINEGQADYHAGILFPGNTNFLETFINDPNGINECNIPRSMDANVNLTADQAYLACPAIIAGEVHVTGRIYAVIWWEARKQAEALKPGGGAKEMDALFTQHLPTLVGSDTFVTALDKIKATDLALFNGAYSGIFDAEYAKRGL